MMGKVSERPNTKQKTSIIIIRERERQRGERWRKNDAINEIRSSELKPTLKSSSQSQALNAKRTERRDAKEVETPKITRNTRKVCGNIQENIAN